MEQFAAARVSTGYVESWFNVGMWNPLRFGATSVRGFVCLLWKRLVPLTCANPTLGLAADAVRTRRDLLVENALLRHQIVVLRRKSPHSRLTRLDRFRLLLGAAILPGWRRAIALVQPDTILRWHRRGFSVFCRRKSRSTTASPVGSATIALIRDIAAQNRLWGAERIRGELLKLGIRVSKRTIQKYMRAVRQQPGGQRWSTFIANHADDIWSCDFLQTCDLLFRPVFALFILHLGSRRVVHVATTRHPTEQWTAQQLRNATMDGNAPKFIIRDRDDKYGADFDRVANGVGTRVIKTAVRAPNMNAACERYLGSVRREALDHVMVLDERHLGRVLAEYSHRYFNVARPHQGLRQRVPQPPEITHTTGTIVAFPVLHGLHHDYRRVA